MQSYKARLNFRQSNEAKEMFGQSDVARSLGVLYHNVMSEIKDSNDIERTLRRNCMHGLLTQEQHDELLGYLEQIMTNTLVASWFDPANRVFAECEILDPTAYKRNKRDQRPDRIVMKDKHITVIDYKFGDEHDNYKGQVKNYMRLLKKLYPGYKIEGYLWYVKYGRTEEV
jgi:ATP-dependent exoDNAse (exonuclease V) beta subunit